MRYLVLVVITLSLVLTGCGIPQEDYDAAIAERDSLQAELNLTQNDLASANTNLEEAESEVTKLKNELSDSETKVSDLESDISELQSEINKLKQLESELEAIKTPGYFKSESELIAWLESDDLNIRFPDINPVAYCYLLQIRALRDGYVISTSLWLDSNDALQVSNDVVIGDLVYAIPIYTDDAIAYARLD